MLTPLHELVGRTTLFLIGFDPTPTIYRQRGTFFGWSEEPPTICKVAFDQFERTYQILSQFKLFALNRLA